MRVKTILAVFTVAVVSAVVCGCTKGVPNYTASIPGGWQYASSTADTMVNGQWPAPTTRYDSAVPENFAESLYFTKTDTVFYYYAGIDTWSNYTVSGSSLILIGGGVSDTFTLRSVTPTTLQFGTQTPVSYYWINFARQ